MYLCLFLKAHNQYLKCWKLRGVFVNMVPMAIQNFN